VAELGEWCRSCGGPCRTGCSNFVGDVVIPRLVMFNLLGLLYASRAGLKLPETEAVSGTVMRKGEVWRDDDIVRVSALLV